MKVAVVLLFTLSLTCYGLNLKESFTVKCSGAVRTFKVVLRYDDGEGETAIVLKATEVGGHNPLDIVIKVAKTEVIEGFTGMDYLRNEWAAYKYLEKKYEEAQIEIPAGDLPTLVQTYFLEELEIFDIGEKQLVLGMECLSDDDVVSATENLSLAELLPQGRKLGAEIMIILNFLQYAGLTHRDIKLENFLLAEDSSVRLIDFAFAYFDEKKFKPEKCGTPEYASVRDSDAILNDQSVNPCPKSDAQSSIYAMIVLITGKDLCWTTEEVMILEEIQNFKVDGSSDALDTMMPGEEYTDLKKIFKDMNKAAGMNPDEKFEYMHFCELLSPRV